jgi:16S rRNA (guanine(966)-N(2))-methyltransferase RsmD
LEVGWEFDVRVIAGEFKGRRLKTPTWDGVRPTSDKLRETLFNVLGARVAGARVLDGYAGTGAVGLEALSRGASHATFVENDRRAAALIEENARMCGLEGGYTIACADFLSSRSRVAGPFDLILLDPPYDAEHVREALERAAHLLSPDGLVVLERATRRHPDVPSGLERVRDVKSGDSTLTMFRAAASTPPPELL